MKPWSLLLALIMFCTGCSSSGSTMKDLSEQYQTVRGRVVAPPSVESHRLFLYIQLDPTEGQEHGQVMVCVAENKEKSEILQQLAARVIEADKPLFVLGTPVHGAWHEFAEGIDFEIYAVGYYNPKGQKYQTVITTYGDRVQDVVRNVGWGNFLKMIGKKAVDMAL